MTGQWRSIAGAIVAAAAALMPGVPAASTITYYHNDLAGSPLAATNASGQVVWRESYRPYGERLTKSAASKGNDVWFTSRRQDPETGLVYMGARYYDPVAGRFISLDPKGFDEANALSFGRYTYANDNPYKNLDPNGWQALPIVAPPPIIATELRPVLEGKLLHPTLEGRLEGYAVGPTAATGIPGISVTDIGARVLGGFLGMDAWNVVSALIYSQSAIPERGKAPEFPGGAVTESGFVGAALRFLGEGAREASSGRYVSADGLRQVRFGKHETSTDPMHAHFEAYDKPGGRVVENTSVRVDPD